MSININIYEPPAGVYGPVLYDNIPDGWGWRYADETVENAMFELLHFDPDRPPFSDKTLLYWVRPPALKIGDRVRMSALDGVVVAVQGNYVVVKWDGRDKPDVHGLTDLKRMP